MTAAFQAGAGELVRAALQLARKRLYHHVLWIADRFPPDEILRAGAIVRRKVVLAVTSEAQRQAAEAERLQALVIPAYDLSRSEKLKLALVAGSARGLFRPRDIVLGLISPRPTASPDSLHVIGIGEPAGTEERAFGAYAALPPTSADAPPEVLEALLSVAVSIGADGWEGNPVGTLFVYGDASRVLEQSRQLTLNPFQGYPESERNLLDPRIRDAMRAFATLDGAFVVRDDGVVLAAGRYLDFTDRAREVLRLPLGLGARHMAGAGITLSTRALALVVSQTSGAVRLFREGKVVLEISPQRRRVGR